MIQPTSRNAYELHRESGKASTQRERLLIILKYNGMPMTDSEAGFILRLPSSTVSARRNELIKKGKVKKAKARKCEVTGFTAYTWEAIE